MSAAARLLKDWRCGTGDIWRVWGKLIAEDRKERPDKICQPQIGHAYKSRQGGVGTWVVRDYELVDGHMVYKIGNDSLGPNFDRAVNFQWIRDHLE